MDNSLRTNIDKIYGKENVELMLANLMNKKRKNNKAHNLLENKSLIKKEISINEMISMGYILKEIPKQQEVKILKTVSIPKMITKPENVIIPKVIPVTKSSKIKEVIMNNWFSTIFIRKNKEITRFEKRNKLKISYGFCFEVQVSNLDTKKSLDSL